MSEKIKMKAGLKLWVTGDEKIVSRLPLLAFLFIFVGLLFSAGSASAAFPIFRTSSTNFDADFSGGQAPPYRCNYVSYMVTNLNGVAYDSVWVKWTTSDSTIVLAAGETGEVNLGPMAVGEAKCAYFYLRTPNAAEDSTTIQHPHTVTVYNGLPSLGQSLNSSNYNLTMWENVIQANANKLNNVSVSTTSVELGSTFTMTQDGDSGSIGSRMSFAWTPSSETSWNPGAFQLYETVVTFSGGNTGTFTNQLFRVVTGSSTTHWVATYKFRVVSTTTGSTPITPNCDIASGTQNKHSSPQSGATGITVAQSTSQLMFINGTTACGGSATGATNLTYSLMVTNAGNGDAFIDGYVDTMGGSPSPITYVSNSSKTNSVSYTEPVQNGQVLTWAGYFRVPAHGTNQLTFQGAIPGTFGTYTNQSYALIGTNHIDTTVAVSDNAPATCNYTISPSADIQTTKSGPTNAFTTSNIVYTITVTNLGPTVSSNVVVIDNLPTNALFVSASSGGFLTNGTNVQWPTMIQFTNGQSTNFTVTVTAPSLSATLTNIVFSTASIPDPVSTNNNGTATNAIVRTVVQAAADIKVSKSGPANVYAGTNYDYTITLTNQGPNTASSIIVTDAVPTGLTFSAASGGGMFSSGQVTWNVSTLTNGGTTNFTLTVTSPFTNAVLTNIVSAGSADVDLVPTNNNGTATYAIVVTTNTTRADIQTSKSGPASINATSNLVYTITVTNVGPSTASNVMVSDTLPLNGTKLVSVTGSGVSNNNAITWPSMTLTNGQVTNFTLTLLASTNPASLTNIVSSTSDTIDLVATNNNGTWTNAIVITTNIATVDVVTYKSGPTTIAATSNIVYTISVTNLGPSTASNVLVSDALPLNGTLFVSATGGGVSNNGSVIWPSMTLTSNAFTNFTLTLTAPSNVVSLTNIVSSTSTTTDLIATNNNGTTTNATVITAVSGQADIKTSKTGPASVNASSNIVYTITVTNLGPTTASNVIVSDALPLNGVTFVSATGGGVSNANSTVSWASMTLTNGAVTNFTLTLQAPSNVISLNLTNIISSISTTADNVSTNNDGTGTNSIVVTTLVPIADVAAAKSGPASVNASSNIVYTISVTNFGPSTASNVLVSDALPLNGTTFVNATGGGVSNNGAVTWPLMTLTNGAVTNFTLTLLASTNAITLTNTVSATSDTTDLVATNNNGTATNAIVTTTVIATADIFTTKSGPTSAIATSNIVYTITVTNLGPSTASNVVVSDALPLNGTTFVSASSGGTSNNGAVTWPAIVTFTKGFVTNFTVTLTAPANFASLTNIASSTSTTTDLTATNNNGTATNAIVITTVSPQADIKTTKIGPASINATSNIVYTISVTNFGPSTASNVVVSDALPLNGTVFVSATGSGASNNGAVTWPAMTLTNGAVTNFTLTLIAPNNAVTLTNIISSTSDTTDNVSTNNNGTASDSKVATTVISIADVMTSKTGPASVNATSNIVYTITVTNLGPSTASNVVVSDVLPQNITFVSATGGGVSNNGAVTWPTITEFTNGAVASFTLTLQASTNAATLTNIISSTSTTTDLVSTNNNGTGTNAIVTTTVVPHADLMTTKVGPASVSATSNIVYTISVTNIGPSTASNVVVSDTLPLGITFISASNSGVSNNGAVTWPAVTSLTRGQVTNFTLTLKAPAEYGVLTNLISSTSGTLDLISTNNDGSASNAKVITTISPEADLKTTKTGPASINATSNVVYTISVTNLGPSTASNVVVSDVLPTNVVFVSASNGGINASGAVTWPTISAFANGAVSNFTVTVTAPNNAATLSNVVFSTSSTTDTVSTNNNGTASDSYVLTTVVPHADIKTTKAGPATISASSNFVYTVTVTNFGPSTAANVVVSDSLPTNVVFVSASGGGSESSGVITWPTISQFTNGFVTNFTVTVQAPHDAATLTNIASSTSATVDLIATNNNGTASDAIVITAVSPFADVITTKIGPASVNATNDVTYTITVTNAGPSTALNVVVADTLPLSTTFVSASGGGTPTGGVITWPTISALTNGAVTNFTVVLRAPDSGILTNVVASTADTTDPVVANNNGTGTNAIVITTVIAQADVKTTKSGPASVNAGQSVTYTITVTNLGPSIATNVVVRDSFPSIASFVSATGSGTTNNSGEIVWPTIPTLASGAGTNYTVVMTAPGDGTMTNLVSSTSSTSDPIPGNNNGSASDAIVITTIIPSADVQTTKTGPPSVNLSSNIVYTITVTNFGPSIAADVVVSDALPSGVTFVSATGGGIHSGGTVTWPAMSLAGSGGTNFTLTVQATSAGTVTNIVSSTSSTTDPVPGNNDGSSSAAKVVTAIGARSISGWVYLDANLNKKRDTDENGTGLTLYAKLIPTSTTAGPATQVATVDPTTGIYILSNLLPDNYIVIIDNNNTLSDVTPTIPASWIGTEIPNQKRENILVNNLNVVNQNFGLAEAATIQGKVFKDTGIGSGTANDGVLNGAEVGISGVTVKLTDASGTTVHATTTTDGAGNYTLYIPNSIASGTSLKVVELNLSNYRSTGGSAGDTGGTYNRATDIVTFTRTGNNSYTEVNFGDVPDNQFVNDGQQSGLPGSTLFYSHIFTAGTTGQVTFSLANTPNPALNGWSQVLYRDSNSNGKLDPGEPTLTSGINVATDEKVYIIVKEFIPHGAPMGAQDQVAVTASFDFSNANPALTTTYTRTDLTTVGTPTTAGLTLVKNVDKATALPGETLTYTITYSNQGTEVLNSVIIFDNTPAYTVFVSAANGTLPNDLTAVTTLTPAVNAAGAIKWTFTGTLVPGGTGTVTFQVKLQ